MQTPEEFAEKLTKYEMYFENPNSDFYDERPMNAAEIAEAIRARDAEIRRECAERGLRYYENTAISERSGEGLYEAISGRKRAAITGEEE